jgi:uncharacterized protein YuzE
VSRVVARHDGEADAAYVVLGPADAVAATVRIDDAAGTWIGALDLDAHGRVLGLEMLSVAAVWWGPPPAAGYRLERGAGTARLVVAPAGSPDRTVLLADHEDAPVAAVELDARDRVLAVTVLDAAHRLPADAGGTGTGPAVRS